MRNQLKLIDFGVSQRLLDENINQLLLHKIGTLKYMAPELRRLNRQIGETAMINGFKADTYSLGITILSLIEPYIDN